MESARLAELRTMSLLPTFDASSSSSDESTVNHDARDRLHLVMRDRSANENRVVRFRPCAIRPCADASAATLAAARWSKGELAVRASAVGATRRRLRADVAFYEAFPRWFALRRLVTTPTEAETVQAYVRERCGGLWHDEAARHVAHHPCLHKRAAPTLQNMTGSDFMQVSAYLHLHTHMDSARLVARVSPKFYDVLRHVYTKLPPRPD